MDINLLFFPKTKKQHSFFFQRISDRNNLPGNHGKVGHSISGRNLAVFGDLAAKSVNSDLQDSKQKNRFKKDV